MVSGIGGPGGSGKVGGPTPASAPPEGSASVSRPTGASFGEAVAKTQTAGTVDAASPLEQLRAGRVDRQAYVELRVQEATAHLENKLAPVDLEKIRAELRDAVEQDPDLAALVRAAEIGS